VWFQEGGEFLGIPLDRGKFGLLKKNE
jgi:hypothetical protein